MRKLLAMFIISINIFCLAIIIMLAKVAMQIDGLSQSFYLSWHKYLPNLIYLIISINIIICLYTIIIEFPALKNLIEKIAKKLVGN